MTTWNHRVLLTEHDLFGPTYDIIEVFYNHDGSVRGYTAADVQSYESPEELRGTIEAMLTAFDHPTLTRAQLDAINRPKADAS